MTPIILPVDQREAEQEGGKPQHWTELRWQHVWPVAIVIVPFLALGALMMAALP